MRVPRTAKSWRPDISTLISSWRISSLAMVARKPDHQGDHEGNRKTIAQGMPERIRRTCSKHLRVFLYAQVYGRAGSARHSLRPRIFRGTAFLKTTRVSERRENEEACLCF
jgi:hypothetical protein